MRVKLIQSVDNGTNRLIQTGSLTDTNMQSTLTQTEQYKMQHIFLKSVNNNKAPSQNLDDL